MMRPTRGGRHQSRKAAENAAQESAHRDTERDSIIAGTTSSTRDTRGVRTDTASCFRQTISLRITENFWHYNHEINAAIDTSFVYVV